ncbi:MAG: PP2C family protein-serine/threonine phosphatase [Ilumatobacter sp.]|uniref:PP2C family protein-serine/threonine phosphatase n=1 Tax=Ilumatobacter sp. TaxID=1967498 RepID=UPI003296FCC4
MSRSVSATDSTAASEAQRLRELQRLLLPASLPPVGCTEVGAGYRSHNDDLRLGGDWYDLVDRPDDQVVAIVGDVVGHGLGQIGVMGQLRAATNALSRCCAEPHDVVAHLDGFARDFPGASMTSVIVVMLDGTTTGRIAAAGHPPMLHVRGDGGWDVVGEGMRPALGFHVDLAEPVRFTYAVDDLLVLFSDGLVERRDGSWDTRVERVAGLVRDHFEESCADIVRIVLDDAVADSEDDMALMIMRPRNHRAPDHFLRRLDDPVVVAS